MSAGAPFAPSLATSAPFDWGVFTPVEDTSSRNLTFATTTNMEQFGCCPKTAGDFGAENVHSFNFNAPFLHH
jgi:hypothetical protein